MLETVPRDEDRSEDKTGTEENVVMLLLYVAGCMKLYGRSFC